MLTVKTYIAPSKIHNLGLFTQEPIAKGTIVSYFDVNFDIRIFKEQYNKHACIIQLFLDHHAFIFEQDDWRVLFYDNGRFINHANNSNLCYMPVMNIANQNLQYFHCLIAIRDIPSGEELTLNYQAYCPQQYGKINDFIERRDANLWPPKVAL
jgi:hypothetical protein